MLFELIACAAFASTDEDMKRVAALFPSASITEIAGEPAISPVKRKGEVGLVRADDISSVALPDGRVLLSFQLDTTRGIEATDAAVTAALDTDSKSRTWTRVLQVALLDANGRFVAKPEGYPLEKPVVVPCFGDFCELGPRGSLLEVEGSHQFVVLELEADPESKGAMVPLRVKGDTVTAGDAVPHGSSGGLSGCSSVQELAGFKEHDGKLRAVRSRQCVGSEPECQDNCPEGFTTEQTLQPVTLME